MEWSHADFDRRTVLQRVGACLLAGGLAGCGEPGEDDEDGEDGGGEEGEEEQVRRQADE